MTCGCIGINRQKLLEEEEQRKERQRRTKAKETEAFLLQQAVRGHSRKMPASDGAHMRMQASKKAREEEERKLRSMAVANAEQTQRAQDAAFSVRTHAHTNPVHRRPT
jgi:hypothetical protein